MAFLLFSELVRLLSFSESVDAVCLLIIVAFWRLPFQSLLTLFAFIQSLYFHLHGHRFQTVIGSLY